MLGLWVVVAQAAAEGAVLEGWAKFLLLLVLQGGSLAILAHLGLRTLPEMLEKLAQMRTADLDRFDARARELRAEMHNMHQESLKVLHRCLTLVVDMKAETTDSINQLHKRLPDSPREG